MAEILLYIKTTGQFRGGQFKCHIKCMSFKGEKFLISAFNCKRNKAYLVHDTQVLLINIVSSQKVVLK